MPLSPEREKLNAELGVALEHFAADFERQATGVVGDGPESAADWDFDAAVVRVLARLPEGSLVDDQFFSRETLLAATLLCALSRLADLRHRANAEISDFDPVPPRVAKGGNE